MGTSISELEQLSSVSDTDLLIVSHLSGNDYVSRGISAGTFGFNDKANLDALAHAFLSTQTYMPNQYVSYNGNLYKCISSHTGAFDPADFEQTTMTQPDVTFTLVDNVLKLIDNSSNIVWNEMDKIRYDIAISSSLQCIDRTINKIVLSGSTTSAQVAFPIKTLGKACDFVIDAKNNTSTSATIEFLNLDIAFSIVVPDGEDLSEMTTLSAGEMARFYVTQTAFDVNSRTTYAVRKQTFVNGGATT